MGKAKKSSSLRLPKRSVIERMTQQPAQCIPEMMALLGCFREHQYDEARCAAQMRTLSDCARREENKPPKRKSTVFFHLKRLLYMQRRR